MRYYIFSDLHIGDNNVNHAAVAATFANIRKEDIVIIVGDGIEDWTKDCRDVVADYYKVIRTVLKKTTVYVVGNHDSFLKPFCGKAYDKEDGRTITFYYPFVILSVDGKKWYIEHGHLCGRYGWLFKFLDRFDNTKVFRDIVKWIVSRKIFSEARKKSNDNSMKKDIVLKGEKLGADVVVVGHDHKPAIEVYDKITLVDPGTAIKKFTYIVYESEKFEMIEV